MKKYIFLIAAILAPIIIIIGYYAIYGQTANGDWNVNSPCNIKSLTGLECPGCGGQRSLHFLLHGHILTALRYNLFLVVSLPFLMIFYIRFVQVYILKKEKYLNSFIFKPAFGYALLIFVVLFFILRNLPFFPFNYLAPPH